MFYIGEKVIIADCGIDLQTRKSMGNQGIRGKIHSYRDGHWIVESSLGRLIACLARDLQAA